MQHRHGCHAGIYVASGAILTLDGGTQIQGGPTATAGTLTISRTGEVQVTGAAALDGVAVSDLNPGTTNAGIDVSGAVLTLDDSTAIVGGTVTVESTTGSQLFITTGSGADGATAGGATLNNVTVTDSNTGSDANAGIYVSGGVLTLDGGTAINSADSGTLTIGSASGSQLQITDTVGTGATLNGLIVDDDNTSTGANAGIYVASGVLTLDGGTQIQGGPTATAGTLTISSTGEVQVTGAAALDGVAVSDLNPGTTNAGIDVSGAVLTLDDSTAIVGGTVTVESTTGSQLFITTGSGADGATAGGATLNNVTVTDSNTGSDANAGIYVSGGVLTLDGGTAINSADSGTLTIGSASGSQLQITDTVGTGATLNGLIVDDDNTGTGANAGIYVASGVLTLKGGTQIQGGPTATAGTLTISSTGEVQVTGAAALDGVAVSDLNPGTTNAGIDVSGAVLTLDDSTAIVGGTVTVESTTGSQLFITTGSGADGATAGGATLNNVTVTDSNTGSDANAGIYVSGGVLTLDGGTAINSADSGTLTIGSASGSQLQITDTVGTGATLNGLIVDDDNTGTGANAGIYVASGVLTLKGNTQIQGGPTATAGTLTISSTGEVQVTGAAALDGVAVSDLNPGTTNAGIDVSGAVLTLDDSTAIVGGTVTVESTTGSQLFITTGSGADGATAGGATLNNVTVTDSNTGTGANAGIYVASGAILTLDGGTVIQGTSGTSLGPITNAGTLEIAGPATLLDDNLANSGAFVQVDDGQTLTLNGTTITSGTVNDYSSTLGGTIDVTGNSAIKSANLNNGGVTVASGVTLILDGSTVTGTAITDPGTIKVDSGQTLTLAGTDSINGGIFNFGGGRLTQAPAGGPVLLSAVSIGDINGGNPTPLTLTIAVQTGTFVPVSTTGLTVGTPGVDGTGGETLTLTGSLTNINAALNSGITYSPGSGTSNTVTMTVSDTAGDSAFRTLTLNTAVNGSPTDKITSANGEISANGALLIDITGTTTLISDTLFNNSPGVVKVEAGELLKLEDTGIYNGTVTDNGTIEIVLNSGFSGTAGASVNIGAAGLVQVDSGQTLKLSNATINGGAIHDYNSAGGGTIEVFNSSTIAGTSSTAEASPLRQRAGLRHHRCRPDPDPQQRRRDRLKLHRYRQRRHHRRHRHRHPDAQRRHHQRRHHRRLLQHGWRHHRCHWRKRARRHQHRQCLLDGNGSGRSSSMPR